MDPPPKNSALHVVIPIVAGIGNALLAVPMVRALKRARADTRITILARIGAMGEPFGRLPEVDQVIVTGSALRLLRAARKLRADVFLVPFPSHRWQYNLLARLSGARRRVMHRFGVAPLRSMEFLAADRINAQRGIHDVEQNLRLLAALGIESPAVEAPSFALADSDRADAGSTLSSIGIDDTFIAIHPGSARTILAQAKRWPAENYARLIEALLREYDQKVVVLEGPDEAGVGDEIVRAMSLADERVTVLRLTSPLSRAAAVLERASLYVGSDSGLAHLAAAVGTKPVTLFAPADPARVCPFGYRDLVVQVNKDCSPCTQYPWHTPYPKTLCREPMCIRQITVEQVMATVRRALSPTVSQSPTTGQRA